MRMPATSLGQGAPSCTSLHCPAVRSCPVGRDPRSIEPKESSLEWRQWGSQTVLWVKGWGRIGIALVGVSQNGRLHRRGEVPPQEADGLSFRGLFRWELGTSAS